MPAVIAPPPRFLAIRREVGPGVESGTGRAAAIEEFVRAGSGVGSVIDEGALYGDTFRRVQKTAPEILMAGSEGGIDDLATQIDTTNGALMAAVSDPNASAALEARLAAAASSWLEEMATGQTELTYPQYLKSKRARRWITGG